METIKKELYETPSTTVVVMKIEGIVCGSPYGTQDYNYGSLDENWPWGKAPGPQAHSP